MEGDYDVWLSDELGKQLVRQSAKVISAYWDIEDRLCRIGTSHHGNTAQLELPLIDLWPDEPVTQPFGADGWIVYTVHHDERRVVIRHIEWPTKA